MLHIFSIRWRKVPICLPALPRLPHNNPNKVPKFWVMYFGSVIRNYCRGHIIQVRLQHAEREKADNHHKILQDFSNNKDFKTIIFFHQQRISCQTLNVSGWGKYLLLSRWECFGWSCSQHYYERQNPWNCNHEMGILGEVPVQKERSGCIMFYYVLLSEINNKYMN